MPATCCEDMNCLVASDMILPGYKHVRNPASGSEPWPLPFVISCFIMFLTVLLSWPPKARICWAVTNSTQLSPMYYFFQYFQNITSCTRSFCQGSCHWHEMNPFLYGSSEGHGPTAHKCKLAAIPGTCQASQDFL